MTLFQAIERTQEQEKIEKDVQVCDRLKLLGSCNKFRCIKRHKLDNGLDFPDWVPKAGRAKFKLLNVLDATIFAVRLLECMDTNRNINKIVDHTEFITSSLTRDIKDNRMYAINIRDGELYAWHDEETDVYCRCKLLTVLNEFTITKSPCEVSIKLIDSGKEKKVQAGNLYKLPNRYIDLPPQSKLYSHVLVSR